MNPKLIHNRVPFASGIRLFDISHSPFVYVKFLTSGNFGKVYKATLETSQGGRVEVAVKSANQHSTEKEKNDFMREMTTMARMLHPNIVYLHGLVLEGAYQTNLLLFFHPIFSNPENLIVLEFLANGDLKTFLQVRNWR